MDKPEVPLHLTMTMKRLLMSHIYVPGLNINDMADRHVIDL